MVIQIITKIEKKNMNHNHYNHQTHHVPVCSDSDSCSEEDLNMRNNIPSSTHNPTRKRRRGIIEKRRRDRINTSLSELKRLVPQALEKSGSAKLEKAEILQMTVDHLKTFNGNNGLGGYSDNTRLARDYHGVGFRECATEVSRYLVSVEGLDIQDPLRIRLMSHLQMFIAQRSSQAPPPPHPSVTAPPPSTNHYQTAWGPSYNSYSGYEKTSPDMFDPFYGSAAALPARPPSTASASGAGAAATTTNYTMTMTATAGGVTHPTPIGFTASVQANPLMIPPAYQIPHHPPSSETATSTASTTPNYANLTSSKPYRPWGAEMAC